MKIVIENLTLPYDTGCRLLKLKYDKCPFSELQDIWEEIKPMTFMEIAALPNLEERRVGVLCLGLERLAAEVKPRLVNKKSLNKTTSWVMPDGTIKEHVFQDVYELYEVSGSYFDDGIKNPYQRSADCYFVKCKDTSTDRNYFIWIEPNSVYSTNFEPGVTRYGGMEKNRLSELNAIMCIAWTIQTNIPQGFIEKIVRQGDCVMIKPKPGHVAGSVRHLTEKEYQKLLVAES